MTTTKKDTSIFSYTDTSITLSTLFLTVFGLIMICSANIQSSSTVVSDVLVTAVKQIAFMVIGYVIYVIAIRYYNFDFIKKHIDKILIIEMVLLLATLAFDEVGGAKAWINLGIVSIQPSEFAKAVIVFTIANYMCDLKSKKIKKTWDLVKAPFIWTLVYTGYIVLGQSDFGSGFVLIAMACIVALVPSNKSLRKFQVGVVLAIIAVICLFVFLMSDTVVEFLQSDELATWAASGSTLATIYSKMAYQFYRFISARNPLWDRFGYSQELLNSLIGMARGSLTGVGLGNSTQKFGYLGSADADYIFAVIVEELGLIGIACVFVPYIIILVKLIWYALKMDKERDKVILIGTASYLFIHLFLNIGGVSAYIPLTGVPLLLVSRGGSALVTTLFMLGVSQSIIRKYRRKNENSSRKVQV